MVCRKVLLIHCLMPKQFGAHLQGSFVTLLILSSAFEEITEVHQKIDSSLHEKTLHNCQRFIGCFAMRIALAQINPTLGDFENNIKKMLFWTQKAADKSCHLIVFPEMSTLGYSPNDLLERPEIIGAQEKALKDFFKKKPQNIEVICGGISVTAKGSAKPFFNSAFFSKSKSVKINKNLLPSYDVFDENRFFQSGEMSEHIVTLQKKKILVLICEDMWAWEKSPKENPLKKIKKTAADVVVSINASPFSVGKQIRRLDVAQQTAKYFSTPVVYVNMVGGQDELIFDGGSFVTNAQGRVIAQSAFCAEDLNIVDLKNLVGGERIIQKTEVEQIHSSLVLGLRDFAQKNGFTKIHLGSSGGIDSAIVAALACDALGPQNVTTIAMPGPFSDAKSLKLAKELSQNLGCHFSSMEINNTYQTMIAEYEKIFGKTPFGVMHENIQARIRGNILMMYANSHSSLLLATGNKSEFATGYSTLYGDMCGGLAPIGDLLKKQVYQLAAYYNKERELIPLEIIKRAPSAELRPNQKDQDSLPEYDVLDRSVQKIVEQKQKASSTTDFWLLKKLAQNEFKRWQAPPILRISSHAFGRGRRFPISNAFYKK